MKASINWLKKFTNFTISNEELVYKLTMAGLEVEKLAPVADDFRGVVVGKILSCSQHTNADKLRVCQVDIGDNSPKQIICGASNARTGIKVAVAKIGAKLVSTSIKKVKLRGIESNGMLCSYNELGLNGDLFTKNGIIELEEQANIGDDVRDFLALNDAVIELDLTPNRGDCFSILGIAREIACYENITLNNLNYKINPTISAKHKVYIKAEKQCPRYACRIIKGINNKLTTPYWLRDLLLKSGQKLHSPIVDISNFVLLELGQPLHSFDLTKITGSINVRFANNEKITLLNEQKVSLTNDTLIIADDDKPLAIAGVMGGLNSVVVDNTNDILLESAFFTPVAITGKAREYKLHSESALRFERGVDFNIQYQALERASELIIQIAGGQAGDIVEVLAEEYYPPKRNEVCLTKIMCDKIIGFELDKTWIKQQFNLLSITINKITNGDFYLTPPSFRFDLENERDIIEELLRLYGYDKIPSKDISFSNDIASIKRIKIADLTNKLIAKGYSEVINYSFISEYWQQKLYQDKKIISLKNPISSELSVMRYGLLAGLIQNVIKNKRYGYNNCRFFETGMCFHNTSEQGQINKIAGIISGTRFDIAWDNDNSIVDFYDIKTALELLLDTTNYNYTLQAISKTNSAFHQYKSAEIVVANKVIGYLGALSPKLEAELSLNNIYMFEFILDNIEQKTTNYKKFSDMQITSRDISILVDKQITFKDIENSIYNLAQEQLLSIKLFDVYTKGNIKNTKKSLSLTINYQDYKKTLTDNEVDEKINVILTMLAKRYNAIQR